MIESIWGIYYWNECAIGRLLLISREMCELGRLNCMKSGGAVICLESTPFVAESVDTENISRYSIGVLAIEKRKSVGTELYQISIFRI